ncbi:hypothetical protein [Stagnihabitans tardus]|uniref:Uncharacterized protein n=1 Tax=Stagnihabitans tardus TaxID=2699202 RepID=A0AAE4YFI4_9RHOB|nr:hypothetical protein [Stagnihabitans tardus]NBZ88945.1 hypothetical protein [Stagnihabitans tardus]
MWDEINQTWAGFKAVFRKEDRSPWTAMLPLLVMAVAWPVLTSLLSSEQEAFMVAFVLAVAIRLAMRADVTVRNLSLSVSGRWSLIFALLFGPLVFAGLVVEGEPIWCQRFLSGYFLMMAGLYLLDVIAGGHAMTRHFVPGTRPLQSDALMARVMAVFYLGLVLLNEAMIQQSLAVWLIYFGLLPMGVNRVAQALSRTVEMAWIKGYGRF